MNYNKLEEKFNYITHYIGAGMAIAGCVSLIVHAVKNRVSKLYSRICHIWRSSYSHVCYVRNLSLLEEGKAKKSI